MPTFVRCYPNSDHPALHRVYRQPSLHRALQPAPLFKLAQRGVQAEGNRRRRAASLESGENGVWPRLCSYAERLICWLGSLSVRYFAVVAHCE